jgi:RNA polymerase sigma-70 factor (ECF subfamily)
MLHAMIEQACPHEEPRQFREDVVHWMERIATSRDRTAFEHLFRHFAPKLKSYMRRLGADVTFAEDLAQETLVQVWRKAECFDPGRATPAAWIFTIARNLRVDRLRKQRFHEVELGADVELDDTGRDGHERTIERIDADRLLELVESLPQHQMQVVRLAFFEGLSHSEIGARLEVPLGTVKSRLRLAFRKLRNALGETE